MGYDINNWPFNWYGLWKENGDNFKNYPSIEKFINSKVYSYYDVTKLVDYLDNGRIIAATSKTDFLNPFTGEIEQGSLVYRTDGVWLWLDDVSKYVANNNICIPNNWFSFIKRNDYKIIVDINNIDVEGLDWPNL